MENDPNIVQGQPLDRLFDTSLGEVLFSFLKLHDDKVLQVDVQNGEEELTAKRLLATGIRLAKWLRCEQIEPGDVVTVMSENRTEFAVTTVAALLAAATVAPLNPDYTTMELTHVLDLSKPKVAFCSEGAVDKLIAIKSRHPHLQKVVLFGQKRPLDKDVVSLEDILQGVMEIDESYEPPRIDTKEVVATILCSSGTTGLPKGVMITHDTIGAFMDMCRLELESTERHHNDPDICAIPMFHTFGFMLMLMNLMIGRKLVVMRTFNLKLLLESIVKYNISRLMVPPPVVLKLLKDPLVKNYDLSRLREIKCGAAPLGTLTEAELKDRLKLRTVSQLYGMTESLSVLMDVKGTKTGSAGVIVAGMKGKVIDEKGNTLGPYQKGELCFKGPLLMKGYIGNPRATAETIDKDGWVHTGDVGYYDSDKHFFIVDRIKELIKYKAFQVAPAELEALLLTHAGVEDVAVVGLPDARAGEVPLAFIVKKPGAEVTEDELKKYVADNLSAQKHLRGGVVFLPEIPRNPSGKVLRRVLRERARRMAKPQAKL